MVEAFEIDSQAKLKEIKATKSVIDSKKTLVFIDHDNKTIFLWRGSKSGLFERLMGTRVAAKLSHTYPKYRIRPIAEGAEPAAFKELIASL